jgi:integrase
MSGLSGNEKILFHFENIMGTLFTQARRRLGMFKTQDDESTGAKSSVGKGKGRDPSGLSFHSLSHTAVTLLKEAGIPHAVVQELIGHDSEQMSEHYTHVGSEALKKAAAAFPDLTT